MWNYIFVVKNSNHQWVSEQVGMVLKKKPLEPPTGLCPFWAFKPLGIFLLFFKTDLVAYLDDFLRILQWRCYSSRNGQMTPKPTRAFHCIVSLRTWFVSSKLSLINIDHSLQLLTFPQNTPESHFHYYFCSLPAIAVFQLCIYTQDV